MDDEITVIRVLELNDVKESHLKFEMIMAVILHGRCNGVNCVRLMIAIVAAVQQNYGFGNEQ